MSDSTNSGAPVTAPTREQRLEAALRGYLAVANGHAFDAEVANALTALALLSEAADGERMREALNECAEWFENRADVLDGDYGMSRPNPEMQMLTLVRGALGEVPR